jgi:hypothetical protein
MKRRKNFKLPGFLTATRIKNGRKVKANTTVKMRLSDLRRLVQGAKTGRRVKVKARVR